MFLQIIRPIFFSLTLSLVFLVNCFAADINTIDVETKIGIFLFRSDDVYIKLVTDELEKKLNGKVSYTIFDGSEDQVKQTNQIKKFLADGGDGLIVNLVDTKSGSLVLNDAKSYNKPIIFFNKEPDLDIVKTYARAVYVGSKAVQSGVLQGEIIAQLWKNNPALDRNNDNVCNFIMLQGNVDNPEAIMRTKYSVRTAREKGIKMQQIGDTILCNWDEDCAYKSTKLLLNVYLDEVDMIISNNDSMALGAIKALQDNDYNISSDKIIPVVGVDGVESAKKAIEKGIMHGTVVQDAKGMAYAISEILFNALIKKPFLNGIKYSFDESGIAVRIPYQKLSD